MQVLEDMQATEVKQVMEVMQNIYVAEAMDVMQAIKVAEFWLGQTSYGGYVSHESNTSLTDHANCGSK